MQELISYRNLTIHYGQHTAVQDISFDVEKGKTLCIVGESGSGKSTLIKAAMDLLGQEGTVDRGNIFFHGEDLLCMPKAKRQKLYGRNIGMIFQDAAASLCSIRTIGSQIYEAVAAHMQASKADVKMKALALFAKIGFEDGKRVWNSYPFELSGGMNQRAAVAAAMMMKPELLLADEPTSALDVCAQKQVLDEIKELQKEYCVAVIIVTHDMGVVEYMADDVLVMHEGCAAEYGPVRQVLDHPVSNYTKKMLAAVPRLRR